MTDSENHVVPDNGKFRRFASTLGAWLQAFDFTSFDYTQDCIDRLERKVVELTEELRRASGPARPNLNDESSTRG